MCKFQIIIYCLKADNNSRELTTHIPLNKP